MLDRHPWLSEEVTFGFYGPVVTQRYRPGQMQGHLQIGPHGFFHNGHDDPLLSRFPEKPEGLFRIILLGGSSMAGNALRSANSQTIAAYLERRLNNDSGLRDRTGLRFQVLNWGYSGAYSFTELVRFFSDGIHVDPDMVMMLDGWNDTVQTRFEHRRMDMPHPLLNWGNLHYQYFDRMMGLRESLPGPAVLTYSQLLLRRLGLIDTAPERRAAVYRDNAVFDFSSALLEQDPGFSEVMLSNWSALAAWCVVNDVGFVAYLQPYAGHLRSAAPPEEREDLESRFRLLADIHGSEWAQEPYFAAMEDSFADYADGLPRLRRTFAGGSARFVDLRGMFNQAPERIYLDQIHYNEYGNELLAERFAADVEAYVLARLAE